MLQLVLTDTAIAPQVRRVNKSAVTRRTLHSHSMHTAPLSIERTAARVNRKQVPIHPRMSNASNSVARNLLQSMIRAALRSVLDLTPPLKFAVMCW